MTTFVRIAYNGAKPYKDRLTGNIWAPGSVKPVPEKFAGKLLRYAEFDTAEAPAATDDATSTGSTEGDNLTPEEQQALQEARLLQEQQDRATEQERQTKENMLLSIESMPKGALREYAKLYDTEIPEAAKVGEMRLQVANLVEQFGVR